MTAAWPESSVTEGMPTLEVRWILPGQLETAVARWFGRFSAQTEIREDAYLLDPRLPGLSVKMRGGGGLEVKVYRGSPGLLEVAGRVRGRMESWQKWSFACERPSRGGGDRAGWGPVRKRRRTSSFSMASGPVKIPPRSPRVNGWAERFVLTARTEVTDRMLIFGERHLRSILAGYARHYNGRRPHRSRGLRSPRPDHPLAGLAAERIKRRPVLGGLINEYERAA